MKKVIVFYLLFNYLCIFANNSLTIAAQAVACPKSKFPTITSWVQACKKMPKNRDTKILVDSSKHSPFFEKIENFLNTLKKSTRLKVLRQQASKEFLYILNLWENMVSSGPLSQENLWTRSNTGKILPESSFYDISKKSKNFQPYIQKLLANSADQFYVHGDLHGDIYSLIIELEFLLNEGVIDENFRIIQDNVWFLFLGDYVDRGRYGTEVIYTLLRLSLANPDRVILVRGNHEEDKICANLGFKSEVIQKFADENVYQSIIRIYDFLPIAFYLGIKNKNIINYLQCCHGGLEVGYDPKVFLDDIKTIYQLLGSLYSPELLQKCDLFLFDKGTGYFANAMYNAHKNKHNGFYKYYAPLDSMELGFMWTDFNVRDTDLVLYNLGRGFQYGSMATKSILDAQSSEISKIRGIIRAHQHGNDTLPYLIANKGVYKMWEKNEISLSRTFKDGLVWTFNVSPDSVYGQQYKYDFHTFAKITLQKNYDDWSMQIFNLNV